MKRTLQDSDSVVRYCNPIHINTDGTISGTAFKLQKKRGHWEKYLSVDHFEFHPIPDDNRYAAISAGIRARFAVVRPDAKLARLIVKSLHGIKQPAKVTAKYLSQKGDSYSGIFFPLANNLIISEIIAERVYEMKPIS